MTWLSIDLQVVNGLEVFKPPEYVMPAMAENARVQLLVANSPSSVSDAEEEKGCPDADPDWAPGLTYDMLVDAR